MNKKIISAFCIVISTSLSAAQLSPREHTLLSQSKKAKPLELLEEIVNINSGSNNHVGIRKIGNIFSKKFEDLGFQTRWVEMPKKMNKPGHLFAEIKGNPQKKSLLLIGHIDTVFEIESKFQKFKIEDGYAVGPGVNDMKGGLVSIYFALKSLKDTGVLGDLNITVAFMGDEEDAGEPFSVSRGELIEIAKKSDYALGFEYGVDSLNFATIARRGFSDWELVVEGKRGHSSRIFRSEFGGGAGFGIAKILASFYDQLPENLLTFNPGVIAAGTDITPLEKSYEYKTSGKSNVIAQMAVAKGDLRAISIKQREKAKKNMQNLIKKTIPGTKARIKFNDSYPPMGPKKGNKELLKVLSKVSQDLGYGKVQALDPGKRGAADTSFVAPYVSCIDGLGLLGDGAHSEDERVEIKSISKVINRTALLIYRLSE